MRKNIRLIVLNYNRRENISKIIDTYKDLIPITVVNNNPQEMFPYLSYPVDVINNQKNWLCMERWHRCFDYGEEYKFIIDDDLLPHPSLLYTMIKKDLDIVGIYGKSGVNSANKYEDLNDHWCVDSKVDFLVGSAILVKQKALDKIHDSIMKIGYPERGDDIIISYLLKKELNISSLDTVAGKVLNLPEGNVSLNKNSNHYSMRWNIIEKFKNNSWTVSESIVK
jgi:hypothetical protein